MSKRISKKWSSDAKSIVNNSKLNLLRVYDNTFLDDETLDILKLYNSNETSHCDFCGQKIKYVSILEFDRNSNMSYFQIGKECMYYLFEDGMKIEGVENAKYQIESVVKKLIKKSSERARAEKYKKELGTYITWLDSLGNNFIERNSFLRFINVRLRTGNGIVTSNMMRILDSMIKKYSPDNTKDLEKKSTELLGKIDTLLEEVEKTYSGKENRTYDFITSVRNFVVKNGNASQKQLDALNKVFVRMKKVKKEQVKVLLKVKLQQPTEYIPF